MSDAVDYFNLTNCICCSIDTYGGVLELPHHVIRKRAVVA